MSAYRVDVLAVMDAAASILVEDGAHHHIPESQNDELRNLREARAAVAELIDAASRHIHAADHPANDGDDTARMARTLRVLSAVLAKVGAP